MGSPSLEIHTDCGIYNPGQVLRGLICISNELYSQQEGAGHLTTVKLLSLRATCEGLEQVDPGWVSSSYFADTPHSTKDVRRVIRYIFQTREAALIDDLDLFPGQDKKYAVGIRLPTTLPPSFKGTCVKYTYQLQVVAKYQIKPFGIGLANGAAASSKEVKEMIVKKPFQVRMVAAEEGGILRSVSGIPTPFSQPSTSENPTGELPMLNVEFQSDADEMLQLQWGEIDHEEAQMNRSESSSRLLSGNLDHFIPHGLEENASVPDSDILIPRGTDRSTTESEFSMPAMGHVHRRSQSDAATPRASGKLLASSVSHKTYNLKLGDKNLVRFSLNPGMAQELHPGATFGGILDFHECYSTSEGQTCDKKCLSVNIMLETEEEINQTWLPSSFKSRDGCTIRKMYCEHVEVTADVLMTNFVFSVPPSAPSSFRTPLMTLRWVLRFEFMVGTPGQVDSSGTIQKPIAQCESLEWKLPVLVRAS